MSPKLLNILLVLMPTVLYFGYIDPMVSGTPGFVWTPEKSIPALQSENVQYIDAINVVDSISKTLKNLDKDYTALSQEEKDKIFVMLPDEIDQIKIRSEIRAMAESSNIPISAIKIAPDTRVSIPGVSAYQVAFSTNAKYPDIKKFIELYERSQRFFVLDTFSIQRQDLKGGDKGDKVLDKEVLGMSVASRIYYFK